jgi:transcriptional regulator with XRE-family HTH domain
MAKSNGHGSMWLTRSYNFIDKDPEIDKFRTIYQKEHIKEDDLAALAGLSTSTVRNMFGGQTSRPQHATFAKMASAMNYEYGLQRGSAKAPDYEVEVPKAKEERKQYRIALRKKRERAERRAAK